MKRVLYIAFFLIGLQSFAQGSYARIERFGSNNPTFTHIISATFTAYNGNTIIDQFNYGPDTQSNEAPQVVFLESTQVMTRIEISYNVNQVEGGNFGDCTVNYTFNVTNTSCYFGARSGCRSFDVEVQNTQSLLNQPSNNTTCLNDLLPLSAENDCNARTYSWQYTTNISNPFQSLGVQSVGTSTVNADLSTVLPQGYTGNVFIRAVVDGKYTNTITFTVIGCTPGIDSVATIPTTCSYSSDGSFTLNFSENLTNENLQFVLKLNNVSGPIIDSFSTTVSGTSYSWPNGLAAGTYFLEYQTLPNGSVITYAPITIASPSPVSFSATWTDVACFGENTGSIAISASGGVGGFEYRFNNGSWNTFSGTNNHNVNNLVAGNYALRVRDANGCTEQQ